MKIDSLIWNQENKTHIARHGVTPQEVEEVVVNEPVFLQGKKGRLLAIGFNNKGRMLAVILDPEPQPGVFFAVTARPASRKERRYFSQVKEVRV